MALLARKNRKKKKKAATPDAPSRKRTPAPEPEARQQRRSRDEPGAAPGRRLHEVFGIVILAAALLLGPSLVSVQAGDGRLMGPFGHAVGTALNWVLGFAGYVVVLVLLVVAIRIFASGLGQGPVAPRSLWRERVGLALLVSFGAVVLHLAGRPHRVGGASLGGLVGEGGAELLCSVVSTAGAWVLGLSGLALALLLATSISWARTGLAIGRLALAGGGALRELGGRARRHLGSAAAGALAALRRSELTVEAGGAAALAPPPSIRIDLTDEPAVIEPAPPSPPPALVEALPQDLEIDARPPPAICVPERPRDPEPAEAAGPEEEAQEVEPAQVIEEQLLGEVAPPPLPPPVPPAPSSTEGLTIVEPQFDAPLAAAAEGPSADEKRVEQGDGPGFVLHGEAYKPPPLSLLEYAEIEENTIDREAIYRQAERLVKTLADYKIEGRVTEVHPGPVVTMYEFVPAPGTRISKIANLANDLAMSLAAQRVRIVAPIPGKGAVGIEVPNERRETVYFKEIVAHDSFRKAKAGLALALGKNIVGAPVTMDLAKMPHLLVAGATGAGKSVSINAMICSLLIRSTPEEVRMILVDPKHLELSGYNDIPHLLLPVVTDPKKASIALRWAVNEMERRYQLLADYNVRDIVTYNRKVEKLREEQCAAGGPEEPAGEPPREAIREAPPTKVLVVRVNPDGSEEPLVGTEQPPPLPPESATEEPAPAPRPRARGTKGLRRLPYIVVVIDEFADLMMVASKDVETCVARLAQKARAAGIHVILATQRPSVDVITGLIKANFPTRIGFRVASGHDSKTILGSQGAENLLGNGDMLVYDGTGTRRLHGAYLSDGEIQRVVDWLKEQGRPVYDMEILKPPPDEDEGGAGPESEDENDEVYDQAVALVLHTRQASISWVQRQLRIGYNRAARYVERMEREGVVSPPDHMKVRHVLPPAPHA